MGIGILRPVTALLLAKSPDREITFQDHWSWRAYPWKQPVATAPTRPPHSLMTEEVRRAVIRETLGARTVIIGGRASPEKSKGIPSHDLTVTTWAQLYPYQVV